MIVYHILQITTDSSFFFQAEDGIRDYKVTGVQTCALPILSDVRMLADIGLHFARLTLQSASAEKQNYINRADQFLLRAAQLRSEERRVGKECREWRSM